jgi:ATP-dependent helicase/nuclease subunit B
MRFESVYGVIRDSYDFSPGSRGGRLFLTAVPSRQVTKRIRAAIAIVFPLLEIVGRRVFPSIGQNAYIFQDSSPNVEQSMSSVTIHQALPGEGLEECLENFVSRASDSPFATYLILPTERLAASVRDSLAEKNVPFLPTRICTLNGFCSNYFEDHRTTTRYLSKAESKILLTRVLMDNKERLPLFFSRSHPSSGTVDDLKTFISVVTSRKVVFPECLLELQSEKSDQIDLIISEYRHALTTQDFVDSDTIVEWTIDHLSRAGSVVARHVFVYGLLNPMPLEQDLLSVLREHSETFRCRVPSGLDPGIFTDPLDWAGPDPIITPFNPSSSYRTQLTGIFSSTNQVDTGGSIRLDTFPSHYAELQGIAAEICRIHSAGAPLHDIAIAFPELRDELGVIEEVFSDFGIPWNAKVSPGLFRYPVIRFLTGIIGVVVNRYAREDVVRLINSPYFQLVKASGGRRLDPGEVDLVSRHAMIEGDRTSWLGRLDRLASEIANESERKYRGINLNSVEQVRKGIRDLFGQLQELEGKKTVRDFVRIYRRILDSFGLHYIRHLPDDEECQMDKKVVTAFISRLDALSRGSLLSPEEKVTPDEFLRILTTIVEETDAGTGDDEGGVSVLGIRECGHQDFPRLFICGMVEGAIPRLTTRLPFTNSLENVRMGTRSLADILHEEEYYFITALLSGERVYLSAPLAEGDKPLLTSAFFEKVKDRCNPEGWRNSSVAEFSPSRSISAIRSGEIIGEGPACQALGWLDTSHIIDDLVGRVNMERYFRTGYCDSSYDGILSANEEIVSALLEKYGPGRVYSPTKLETYAQCPFRFFLNSILYLNDLPEVEPNLSASDRGTLVHDILTRFYRKWHSTGHSKVSFATMTEAVELMREIVEEQIARYSFGSPLWEATCIQMRGGGGTGPGYLARFLEKEAEEEASSLVPSCFEFSFGITRGESDDLASVEEAIELSGPEGTESLRISGRIDRIDRTSDGCFLIYDYKTGKYPKFKDIEAGKALQLPLYTLAFEAASGGRGVAAGYYEISNKSVKRSMLLCAEDGRAIMVSRPRTSPDFARTLNQSREFALEYIGRIRKGEFPLPHEEKCPNKYCEFRRICRFDPYRVFDHGEAA